MRCFGTFLKQTIRAVACVGTLASTLPASAETVEVAPGVQVTKRTYPAPVNEQPFFGFAAKSSEQKAEDEKFVSAMIGATGSREKAFEEATKRAWIAIQAGKIREAALRFNQAFLVSPEQSSVYHGFAVIAQARFNDLDAAEELFKIALKQPNPVKPLKADSPGGPRLQRCLDQSCLGQVPERRPGGGLRRSGGGRQKASVEQFHQRSDRGEKRRAVQIARVQIARPAWIGRATRLSCRSETARWPSR